VLYTPGNHFNWSVDNFGTFSDAAAGVNVPGHANANQKGANTAVLSALAEDCYWLVIFITGGSTAATIRRQFTDILIDPAGGTSWSVAINNLYSNNPSMGSGLLGCWYSFPLFLKAGTAIGAAHQDTAATTQALRVAVRAYGKPTRPDLLRVGTRVQTLGADTATTAGVAVTPGTSGSWGSYTASLGTLNNNSWWWQVGVGTNDTTMNTHTMLLDVAVNATNKLTCLSECMYGVVTTNETAWKTATGASMPIRDAAAGENVYVRANCVNSAADATNTVVAYAVS